MRILTSESMRALDRYAIEEIGIPGLVLMENAAIGAVEVLVETADERDALLGAVLVVCGPGNNGADGLAMARHLATRGIAVECVVVDGGKRRSADLETQRSICGALGLDVSEPSASEAAAVVAERSARADIVVDALFGTGLSRPLKGVFAEVVASLSGAHVFALDLPSGLDGSRAEPIGPHLSADVTVTFAAPKVAHALSPASDACGALYVVDLGFPPGLAEAVEGELRWIDREGLVGLRHRPRAGHKGTFGHLLVAAGGRGTSGAAVLAARAAGRSGVGLVTVATPPGAFDAVESGSVESMTIELGAAEDLLADLAGKTALALGPGALGEGWSSGLLTEVALAAGCPAVLDAEALNAFRGAPERLRERSEPTVLTPHPGEIVRLLDGETPRSSEERLDAARKLAEASGAVVVLKGRQTLVAEPAGQIYINTSGGPALATGGSGDVLTGLIGGLLAQGVESSLAARVGVFLHGSAGDLAAAELGERAVAAQDVVAALGAAWRALEVPQ